MNNEKLIKLPKQVEELSVQMETIALQVTRYINENVIENGVMYWDNAIKKSIELSKNIIFPNGEYLVKDTIFVRNGVKINGCGSTIKSATGINILDLTSNTIIENLNVVGVGNTYNSNHTGINVKGAKSNIIDNITIKNVNVENVGMYGVYLEFAENVDIVNCNFKNICYGAIGVICSKYVEIDSVNIDTITGYDGLAYGVFFSRLSSKTSLEISPRSEYCSVRNSTIKNIPIWEGLDTHGGSNLIFENNKIKDCKKGIVLTVSRDDNGNSYLSPQNCIITNNIIEGNNDGFGIVISCEERDIGSGNIISNNILNKCGETTNTYNGAITIMGNQNGTMIINNQIKNSSPNAICFTSVNNKNIVIRCNTITEVFGSESISACAILLKTNNHNAIISDNVILGITPSVAPKYNYCGITQGSGTSGHKILMNNNIIEGFLYPYSGISYTNSYNGILNYDVKVFASNGEPEGNVEAPIGSIYLCVNGRNGKTLYVKESGVGNTGWIAK